MSEQGSPCPQPPHAHPTHAGHVRPPRYVPSYPPYQLSLVGFPQPGMMRFPMPHPPHPMNPSARPNPAAHSGASSGSSGGGGSGDKSSRETSPPASEPPCCSSRADASAAAPAGAVPPPTGNASSNSSSSSSDSPAPLVSHPVPPSQICSPGPPHFPSPGYPVLMSPHMFSHMSSMLPHSTPVPGGFISHSIQGGPVGSFSPMPAAAAGQEYNFLYSPQYPGGPVTPQGAPLPPGGPMPHFYHFGNPSSGPSKKSSCYNCGRYGHRGNECKDPNVEELCQDRTPT